MRAARAIAALAAAPPRRGRRGAGQRRGACQPFQVNGNFTCFQKPSGT